MYIPLSVGSAQWSLHPFKLNVLGAVNADFCVKFATLIQIVIYWDSAWYYAPGNPFATPPYSDQNVIWAQQLVAAGAIYAIPNNSAGYLIASEFIYEDCYGGNLGERGGVGGTC